MPGGHGAHADDVGVVFHGLFGDLARGLEEGADIHIEAEIGEGGGDHLGAAVVAVLADLGDHDARAAAFAFFEGSDHLVDLLELFVFAEFLAIDAADGADGGLVATVDLFHGVGDFPKGGAGAGGLDAPFQEVALAGLGGVGDGVQRRADLGFIPLAADLLEPLDLGAAHGVVVDVEDFEWLFLGQAIFVAPDDGFLAGIDLGLATRGGLFDAHLGQARLDGLGHAAEFFDLLHMAPGALDEFLGEGFHVVRAAPGVDHLADAGLVLEIELGVAGDARGEVGGERNGLVESVGMQALGVPKGGGHAFDDGAGDVVVGVLFLEAPAGGLGMGAERQGLGILGTELVDGLGPEQARGPHLGHLHEVVHADGPEEGDARGEGVDVHAGLDAGAQIFESVGEGVAELDVGGGPGLLHMVAGDADAVELRHLFCGVGEDVADDAHGRIGGVDVGVADHELFEDVVLDGAGKLFVLDALLLAGDDEVGKDGQDGAVHGHGDGHLVQGDAVEENVHVGHGVDGDPGLAHITDDALVVGIVAAVCGEIEGDGEPHLPCGEVAAIEGVALLGGGESGVLTDGPGLGDVHAGVRTPEVGGYAGDVAEVGEACDVILCIEWIDVDVLHGARNEVFDGFAGGLFDLGLPGVETDGGEVDGIVVHFGEIRDLSHFCTPDKFPRDGNLFLFCYFFQFTCSEVVKALFFRHMSFFNITEEQLQIFQKSEDFQILSQSLKLRTSGNTSWHCLC